MTIRYQEEAYGALYKKAIMRTFQQMLEEMPFDKITVSALVRRCEISSNTFYYHYQDIYALLDVWFHTVFDPYVQCDRPDFDWRTAIKEVLRACQAHPRTITMCLTRCPETSWSNMSSA